MFGPYKCIKGKCFLPNCEENITCFLFDAVKMMTVGCGLNAVQLPFSAHFDPKLPEMFLSEGTTLRGRLQKCTHPPTISPLLIQLKFISTQKGSLWKLTLIFLHFPHFATFCDISPQTTFGNIQQLRTIIFCSECFFCFSAFIYLLRIYVCSNLAGRQIQSWT